MMQFCNRKPTYLMQFTNPQFRMNFFNSSLSSFGTLQKLMFKTDTPAKSGKYQKGLYHLKTHGQRKQRCFSMKWSLITMKPNIMRKTFYSKLLQQHFRIFISMKARKCIMKQGSFDNYILFTKPEQIDSKFGLYLRKLMEEKKADPKFKVPYIPGTAIVPKTKKS